MRQNNQIVGFVKWLLKWLLLSVLAIVLIIFVIIGMLYSFDYWTHDRHIKKIEVLVFNGSSLKLGDAPYLDGKENKRNYNLKRLTQEERTELNMLEVSKLCPKDKPIYIEYKNNSSKIIEYIKIDFTAHLPKYSSNILEWGATVKSDFIVQPDETAMNCINLPIKKEYWSNDGLRDIIYESEIDYARFKKN